MRSSLAAHVRLIYTTRIDARKSAYTSAVFWEAVLSVIERKRERDRPASGLPLEALPRAFFGGCAEPFVVVMLAL